MDMTCGMFEVYMFDRRLFSLVPGTGRLLAGKVIGLWVSLLADVSFVLTLVAMLGDLLTSLDSRKEPGPHFDPYPYDFRAFLLVFALILLVKYAAVRTSTYFGTKAAERVKLALRTTLYRKMLALGPSYSQRVKTSDVVQSAGEGIEQIQSFFELFIPQLAFSILAPITLFFVIMPLNLPAALVLLVCAPLIVVIVGLVARSASRVFGRYWGKYTDMGAAFLDDLQGLETLKNFDADGRAAEVMNTKAEEFRVMTMKVLQIQLRSLSSMDLVAYGGSAAGIAVAVWQFAIGELNLPGAVVIALLSASFFIPLRLLGSYFHVAMNGMTSTRRIFALLDAPVPEHGDQVLPAAARVERVVFDSVGYDYAEHTLAARRRNPHHPQAEAHPQGQHGHGQRENPRHNHDHGVSSVVPALHDVDFAAKSGRLTAIVGVSGSGKSTAAALLSGRLGGYSGSLSMEYKVGSTTHSVQISNLAEPSLASAVTVVSAHSHLFAGTLRENLLMARPDATDNDCWIALERARIDGFVCAQPDGLNMRIEQGATNLSGGQRQRFAIARALLRDSQVYVFDEATSSVDAESEELILQTIRELARHTVVIMITHRLANTVDAGEVEVFKNGSVVESGSNPALLVKGGEYAHMFATQQQVEDLRDQDRAAEVFTLDEAKQTGTAQRAIDGDVADHHPRSTQSATSTNTKSATKSAANSGGFALIGRLLRQVGSLSPFLVQATLYGTIGHLAAAFIPMFGIFAVLAQLGQPQWGMDARTSLIAMAICALLRGAMRYAEQYMNHNVAFRLLALFRAKEFAALRRLAPAKFSGRGKGDLIALVTTDVELLEIFFAHTISPVAIAVSTTVVFSICLWTFNPWFTLLLIVSHVVVGVIMPRWFSSRVKSLGPKIRKQSSELDDLMIDDMRGLDETIRFGQGDVRVTTIAERTKMLSVQHERLSRKNGIFAGFSSIIVILFTVAAGLVALGLDPQGLAGLSGSIAAVVLISGSFGPTMALSALPGNLTKTFAAARRMFSLLDETPAVQEDGRLTPSYEGMSMDDVSFAYADQAAPLFSDVTLHVPATGILGVRGPSGRGKSTLLKLLMRYWDPQRGEITLSGVPLNTVDAHHRRTIQTLMSQDTYLFDGTIRSNLLVADPKASDEQLREALAKASVLELIDSLPDGMDSRVGELGDRLSEGERQRIGLARVFLRNADLILFDEPTSRLDAFNEAVILQSINGFISHNHDTAAVLVSHRGSTMRIADRVLNL